MPQVRRFGESKPQRTSVRLKEDGKGFTREKSTKGLQLPGCNLNVSPFIWRPLPGAAVVARCVDGTLLAGVGA